MRIFVYLTLISLSLVASEFVLGVGGFKVCENKYGASYFKQCSIDKRKNIATLLKKELPNVNAVSMWITRDWKEEWYSEKEINGKLVEKGYVPIFIFYWFADDISPSFVKKHKKEYFQTLKRFSKYLQKIKGKKIVILNPEFNENGIVNSREFDLLQINSIFLIKKENPDALVGICLGDFGDYSVIWDEKNWKLYKPSMLYSAKIADFIAFQEMRALNKNSTEEILDVPLRALAFATYLHKTYKKPTFLAYLAISSYGKNGEKIQKKVMREFKKLLPLFRASADLMGVNLFHFIDFPKHNGYFGKAEKFFGIKKANGKPKPAFYEFKRIKID